MREQSDVQLASRLARGGQLQLCGIRDADRFAELEVAHHDRRSRRTGRVDDRSGHQIERHCERQDGLAGKLVILEVRLRRSREREARLVREPARGSLLREQHGTCRPCAKGVEEGALARGIVEEGNSLFDERGAGEGRNALHHRRPVPGRKLERQSAQARAELRQERGGAREGRVGRGVVDLSRVSEAARPGADQDDGADRIV